MKPNKTAIFSDLDGTLFDSNGQVSPENRAAIEAYIQNGGLFAISTGRDPRNAAPLLRNTPINAPCVVINGAAAYDYSEQRWLFVKHLNRNILYPYYEEMIRRFPEMDFQLYTQEEGIVYTLPTEQALQGLLALHKNASCYMPFETVKSQYIKSLAFVPEPRTQELRDYIAIGEQNGWFRIVPGTAWFNHKQMKYYEMLPVGADKGTAIELLRQDPRFSGRMIVGLGDYWNDEEMLRAADYSVCPDNVEPGIKELCQWIGPDNDHHLLKAFIEDQLPLL